ncbi:hypothetical protein SK128_008393, partial [Halocaridina rubra]
ITGEVPEKPPTQIQSAVETRDGERAVYRRTAGTLNEPPSFPTISENPRTSINEPPLEAEIRPVGQRFTHFGIRCLERREPEGFEASESLPPSISTTVSRINPLLTLAPPNEEDETRAQEQESPEIDVKRKVKLSNFSKAHYWFRSQNEREESVIETKAETISEYNDDNASDSLPGTVRSYYMPDDDASFS